MLACFQQTGVTLSSTYQPADRFWVFQGIETLVFLTLAALLIGLAFWWLRRRIS